MRKALVWVVLVALTMLCIGCSTEKYKVIFEDGSYYIAIDRGKADSDAQNIDTTSKVVERIYFDSLEEMREDIIHGNFTEKELSILANWCGNEGKTQVANIDALIEPRYPSDAGDYRVSMLKSSYHFDFRDTERAKSIRLVLVTNLSAMNEKIEKWTHYQDSVQIEFEKIETVGNETAYYFVNDFGEKCKIVIYCFNVGEAMYYVQETYRMDNAETIPCYVEMIGTEQDHYFTVYVSEPEERLSAEWLSSFGLMEYVPKAE